MRWCTVIWFAAILMLPCSMLVSLSGQNAEITPSSMSRHVRGVFALLNRSESASETLIADPDLAGISLRAGWSQIQPTESSLEWPWEQDIQRARKRGKPVMLRASPGHLTPPWVYRAGAHAFSFIDAGRFSGTGPKSLQMPIPWDPIFLDKWKSFISAMGKKYAQNDAVMLVHMAGPGRKGAEMHLPKTKQDKRRWQELGYSKERVADAWTQVIDAYAKAFPQKALALDVSPVLYDDGVVERVMEYAVAKIGERLHIQHNGLCASKQNFAKQHQFVLSCRGKAVLGFQLLCPATPAGKSNDAGRWFGGPLAEAFRIGLEADASYFEIYPLDLSNRTNEVEIRKLAKRLESNKHRQSNH